MKGLFWTGFAAVLFIGCQQTEPDLKYAKNPQGISVVSGFDISKEIESVDCNDTNSTRGLKLKIEKISGKQLSARASAQIRLAKNFISDQATSQDCEQFKQAKSKYYALDRLNQLNTPFSINVNVAYHPDEKAQVDKAFNDYGPLKMELKKQSIRIDAAYAAWSGYWYPVSNIDVLIGKKSPLEKLDRVLAKQGRSTGIIDYERDQYDLSHADSWEGHCHAWSIASVIFPEPLAGKKIGGQNFSITDIKGVFTKAAEATPYVQYGVSYRGNHITDGTFQDLRPEAFHHLIVEQLKINQPVLIDDDAGPEVWTRPVLSMRSQVKPDPKVRNAILVKTWLQIIKQKNDLTEPLTDKDDASYWALSYRLHLDPYSFSGAKRRVLAGEWIDASFRAHPDVIIIPDMENFKSNNPVLNKNLDLIKKFY